MRHQFGPCVPVLFAVLAGCSPGYLYELSGDYGVAFSGRPDCAEADVTMVGLEAPFTLDIYLQANANAEYAIYPVFAWTGAFAIYQDQDRNLVVGPLSTDGLQPGITTPTALMDGGYHHLAVTQDAGLMTKLYLDGDQKGNGTVDLASSPGSILDIGCWSPQAGETGGYFTGTIGELRLQSGVVYKNSFTPAWTEFVADEATLALWHFNEGQGEVSLEDGGLADAALIETEWVPFLLNGTMPGGKR